MRQKFIFLCHKCSGVNSLLVSGRMYQCIWPNCNIFPTNGIYLKFSMSKFPGYPKSGSKIGGPKSKKSSTSDLNIFHTRFTRLKLPQLPGSTTDLPRGCLGNWRFSVVDGFLQKFPVGEYRQNQFKWKQTIGNLKLTASLQFTPENGCLEDKPFLLGRPIFRDSVYY